MGCQALEQAAQEMVESHPWKCLTDVEMCLSGKWFSVDLAVLG